MESGKLTTSEQIMSSVLKSLPIKHGKHRLLDKLARTPNKSRAAVSVSIKGKSIVVDPSDLVGWHFSMLGTFDPEVIEILETACDPAGREVLWDIGANKGACFCCLAASCPNLSVVAFEPQSALAANNIHNLSILCPGRNEYVQAALGESEAELTLTIPRANAGRASFHTSGSQSGDHHEVVKVLTASTVATASASGGRLLSRSMSRATKHRFFGR